MESKVYRKQVALMLSVIPEVAKENCFALHGGTAINLFKRNMPRLSVDIDLTYIPIEERLPSLANIALALEHIKLNINKVIGDAHIIHKKEEGKLLISSQGANIKLEVNTIKRGLLKLPTQMTLCEEAQIAFDVSCSINVVSLGELYGGKICAALDRQHPRDLFDVKYLLNNEGFTHEIKTGFFFAMLGSAKPIHEILFPQFHNQASALDNQFGGMTAESFKYEEFEAVRENLVQVIHENLTDQDIKFILSVNSLSPDWSIYSFEGFPAILWKLQNLQNLRDTNPTKFHQQNDLLKEKLESISPK